ncbi:hypothetical protein QAD02_016832 [Eretmocerus hayati]|uniref:Uncharacterized protein n=1 Tax=Eretmocerus hayati TaxID=131215 RepID=A0ACC2PH10_9HYME|nr:hypothetical protein QAD02_016832 [Eretmocerus hayati]
MAAIPLSESTICRLCAEENDSGEYLFTGDPGETDLSAMINRYLPLKVYNDGKLPRTICPGCNIQLEATAQFFELLINGQRKLCEMLNQQKDFGHLEMDSGSLDQNLAAACNANQQEISNYNDQHIIVNVEGNQSLYEPDHELIPHLEILKPKPKKRRGRPSKNATEESEAVNKEGPLLVNDEVKEDKHVDELDGEGRQKRLRKIPKRFEETVQGKEFENIFKKDISNDNDSLATNEPGRTVNKSDTFGSFEEPGGKNVGDSASIDKAKNCNQTGNQLSQIKKKEKYTCPYCDKEFVQRSKYIVHKSFHKITKYECTECYHQFSSAEKLSLHQKATLHSGKKKIEVNDKELERDFQAGLDIATAKNDQHSSSSNSILSQGVSQSLAVASEEGVAEDEEQVYLEYFDSSRNKSTFRCIKCNKHYISKDSLESHIKVVHQGEKPFKCELCYKIFAYESSLKGHMEIVHQSFGLNDNFFCDLCGKQFSDTSSLVQHKLNEHDENRRYVCNTCGKSFKHKQLLHRHQLVHSEDRPYPCKSCDASFKTKANLLNHQSTHTGEKKFFCELCNQKFAHKTSLTLHYRTHTGQKPYKCEFCSKSFSQNGNLQEHLRIHTGEKPYRCDHCGRKFTTSSQFKLHVKRHTGERPWKCEFCEKSFLHKDTWKCHVRRHTGERPFQCTVCKRDFTEQWALKKHMRLHTGEKPYSCDICGKAFADCSNLTKHRRVHKTYLDDRVRKSSNTARINKVSQISTNSRVGGDSQNNATTTDENSEEDMSQIFYVSYQDSDQSNDTMGLQFSREDIEDPDESIMNENSGDPIAIEFSEEPHETNLRLEIRDEDGNAIPLSIQEARQLLSDGQIFDQSIRGQTIRIQSHPVATEINPDSVVNPEMNKRSSTLKASLTPIQTDAELIKVLEDEDTESTPVNEDDKPQSVDSQQTIEFITQNGQKVRVLAPIDLDAMQLATGYLNI